LQRKPLAVSQPREVELPRAGVLSRNVSPLGALDRSEDAGVRSERLSLDREAVNRLGVNFSNAVTGESTVRLRINQ
jgi:hypothetical protein